MYEAKLYEKLATGKLRCNTCNRHCAIGTGRTGVCGAYKNEDGVLYSLNYGKVSSLAIDPVEKKPLFHFHPATKVFSLGTWGCNFQCKGCQNWQIACPEDKNIMEKASEVPPEKAVSMATSSGCEGIAFTYNEPGIWLEYALDTSKLAKEQGLYTAFVTNGYSTEEALDEIAPFLDAWRVDIKGFTDEAYKKLAKIADWQPILKTAERAKHKWGMHVEVVTNITPGINDDEEQLTAIAAWIKESLGALTPWHITRFYPCYDMQDVPPTPVETLEKAYRIGKNAGLYFIYMGNVPEKMEENTTCYNCGKIVVQRFGYQTSVKALEGSKCAFCGAELGFITQVPKGERDD